jgi:two-component system nitrogen regulation response regulator GlnG/two-component system response regulator HydG
MLEAEGQVRSDEGGRATTLDIEATASDRAGREEARLALVVIWWGNEPSRVGEVLLPEPALAAFGRGAEPALPARAVLHLVRQQPEANLPAALPADRYLSRRHLLVRRSPGARALTLQCVGKRRLRINGVEREQAEVREGDVLEIDGVCSFLCAERAPLLPASGVGPSSVAPSSAAPSSVAPSAAAHVFGEADAYGIAGESAAAWELRRRIALLAARNAHVLVTGPSGAGKELVAQAIHGSSARGRRPLVSRSAPTIPAGVADAELFGNAPNYPNVGMNERPGLIGQADGSSLFLDELGELPLDVQTRLLRVLDRGEYQRLGDARTRSADIRFIAATNRDASVLKPDLAARFALRVGVPGLDRRLEDVPLVARHLLRAIAARDPALGERYFSGWNGSSGEPRFAPELIYALVTHEYTTHVRELERLLLLSVNGSRSGVLELTADVRVALRPRAPARAPDDVAREDLRAALARHGGVKERAWRELGLSSRHALTRLMKKLGEG